MANASHFDPRMSVAPPSPHDAWPMPTALRASVGVHLLAAGAAVVVPSALPWLAGGLVANHALLTAAGLWPRSTWLGPNIRRLPEHAAERGEVALTIDDGPDPEVTPAVLDLLGKLGARATFFCIADRAAEHPALTREIVRCGHSVQNHSARHAHNFSMLGPRGIERELSRAQDTLFDMTGIVPRYFRAPAGLRNPFLGPVLHSLGLELVSWTRRGFDTRDTDASRVAARLCTELAAGDILLLHDGHAARTERGRPVVLEVLPELLGCCRDAGLVLQTLPEAMAAQVPAHADATTDSFRAAA